MAKRARAEWTVDNADLTLDGKYLYSASVPITKHPTKEEKAADPSAKSILYHVHVRFPDFSTLKTRAIEKVLHSVGHAIGEGKIRTDEEAAELDKDGKPVGYTTVDDTGYPPEAKKEKTLASMKNLVESAASQEDKLAMVAALKEMMEALGMKPEQLPKVKK